MSSKRPHPEVINFVEFWLVLFNHMPPRFGLKVRLEYLECWSRWPSSVEAIYYFPYHI